MAAGDKELEQEFIASAITHHELTDAGDSKGSKAAHKKAVSAMKKMRQRPDKGESFLKEAIRHPHANVRLWAATYLLPIDPPTALARLKTIIESRDDCPWQVRGQAEAVIDLWKKGQLELI